MKSPYNFIVKPLHKKRYNNTKDIGEVEFITSVSQEDHTSSNRFAEVIELMNQIGRSIIKNAEYL